MCILHVTPFLSWVEQKSIHCSSSIPAHFPPAHCRAKESKTPLFVNLLDLGLFVILVQRSKILTDIHRDQSRVLQRRFNKSVANLSKAGPGCWTALPEGAGTVTATRTREVRAKGQVLQAPVEVSGEEGLDPGNS